MTKEEFAAQLNGREYLKEITEDEERLAKESGLLVVFGYSDDNVELRGVINDEVGAYDGTDALIDRATLRILPYEIGRDEKEILENHGVYEYAAQQRTKALIVTAEWCKKDGYSWTFVTEEPHATFDIMEGDEKFCRGIVISL